MRVAFGEEVDFFFLFADFFLFEGDDELWAFFQIG